MYLLDTSAWIHYLNREHLSFETIQNIVVCPPVIQEVLQGIRHEKNFHKVKNGLFALPSYPEVLTRENFLQAAEIFRLGRQKGFTIRSSIDCLIASIAIEHSFSLVHFDRDFDFISQYTSLRIAKLTN